MQVAIDNISELEKKVNIVLSTKEIDEAFDKKIDELSMQAHLEGFRQGKKRPNKNVRKRALQLRYGNSIREEVLQELMEKSFQDTVTDNKFKIIGSPDLDVKQKEKDKDVEYSVSFEIMPEIKLDDINKENFTIEKKSVVVSDSDVKFAIEKVLTDSGKFEEQEDKIEDNFIVEAEISYEVNLGKKKSDSEENTDEDNIKKYSEEMKFDLTDKDLGDYLFDPKKLLVGKKSGDEVSAEFTYPKDYFSNELANKKASVQIKIKKTGKIIPAKLDKEFYAKFGINNEEEQTEEFLNKKIKETLEKEAEKIVKNKLYADLSEELSKKYDFSVPNVIYDGELGRIKQARSSYCNVFKNNDDHVNITDDKAESEAKKASRLTVVISRFAEDNGLTYSEDNKKNLDKKIQAKLHGLVDVNEMMYYSQVSEKGFENYMNSLKDLAYNHIVLDELINKVNLVEKQVSYKDLIEKD
tara:strand:- start:23789 stop:25189 length:1401 start_codon:yes stop_codon:yes gene_type:complete